ncbi:hypothetical protein F4212_00895 [Candidatus Poribacteria bacterium]|nr:hypothetical protein [Candidatus Poribacteria bacterium]
MSDSIVDWLLDFSRTEGLRGEPRLSVEKTYDDVRYTLSYRGRCVLGVEGAGAVDHLYRFIMQNAPVSTSDIHAGGLFCVGSVSI